MVCLPRVERAWRPEDGAVALNGLDLARNRGDDPIANLLEDEECVVELLAEVLGPDDPRGARLDQLDGDSQARPSARTDPLTT